ncbi:MAG TPA: polysaccharide deacetylase family protein [Nitrososphaerales archaeon]|nr:polysaccharide deacetylase family protein [Nitrososphaerales archaeon]
MKQKESGSKKVGKNRERIRKRDFVGYANRKFNFSWPDGKRLALSIVVNYEEGSEHSYPVDTTVEGLGEFLPVDIPIRDVGNESSYEYGPRVAIWRILDTLKRYNVKATFFATATALQFNELAAKAIVELGHEICDHGLRWTEHFRLTREQEKRAIRRSVEIINRIIGKKPVGFYAREPSQFTLGILQSMKNFLYDSDEYNDDLPYRYGGKDGILILPYSPDVNDLHFQSPMHRFSNSHDFLVYLKDTFDVLRAESQVTPKMMSVGLHCRVIGRPGRIVALTRFLEYVGEHKKDVWVATREEIARYWINHVEGNLN